MGELDLLAAKRIDWQGAAKMYVSSRRAEAQYTMAVSCAALSEEV